VENIDGDLLLELMDETHDVIHSDRKLAVLLLERAERLEAKMHAFLHDANNQEDAEVIPLRDTDGDK
jgi:hypothetical protein|tara:strand:+ start:17609 stop:17809 length:201 start_codon:yes stop_codon:yes gene_type:complete